MSPTLVGTIILGYFGLLMLISQITSRNSNPDDFYTAHRQSPWYLVAFGMIGTSLSGVTFISVPGNVGVSNFYYFQMVIGYLLGYFVIATVLMPLYYRLNLVSIYSYLDERFGFWSYKTGALFFLVSRIVGACFRLFLVATVLQLVFFDTFGFPFWVSVITTILLIYLYTFKGGIKTIVVTDTLQTAFMLSAVIVIIWFIKDELNLGWSELTATIIHDSRSQIFDWNWANRSNFFKQFFSGAFIAIVMTGLDQDMMQKNLTCRNINEAKKNIFWLSLILIIVNLLFLALGVLLFQYAEIGGIEIPMRSDHLFPILASKHFSLVGSIVFLLGITAAAYSSADSALTALTTSFCVDFLGFKQENFDTNKTLRIQVHLGFAVVLFIVVLIFNGINDQSVIDNVFKAAGYTYGPLLGLFAFGIMTKSNVKDQWVPYICLSSPILSYLINLYSQDIFWGYQFGFEILILNGSLTFIGLIFLRKS